MASERETQRREAGRIGGKGGSDGEGSDRTLQPGQPDKMNGRQGKQGQSEEKEKKQEQEQPPGGVDRTPLSALDKSYTVQFTFHRATNVPVSDFGKRSSDPYLLVDLHTSQKKRNPQDPAHRFRTQTLHRTTEPQWHARWIVAGVPADGFGLKIRLIDEDSPDMDDKLGKVKLHVPRIGEGWELEQQEYKVHKRGGDTKAYALRWCTSIHPRRDMHATLYVSAKVIGVTKERMGKTYTVNNFWWQHYSPMIGRIAGTRQHDDEGIEKATFQSNEIQMQGPVPNELYHRYVEFKPFVAGMFRGKGVRGRLLNTALHTQHSRIYCFDPQTKYGELEGPGEAMTLKFLDMVDYDRGGRIFTYVITLDGLFRFTETGKEFGIDLLSKHTMHSDVNIYIAFSGEFLVRRLKKPNESAEAPDQETHPADDVPGGPPDDDPPKDAKHYELIIDNDSGTYRPDKKLLPVLHDFLKRNFPDLHVQTYACDDKELEKIKKEQTEVKSKEGDHMVFGQQSDASSISSSEASDLADRADAFDDEGSGQAQGDSNKGVLGKTVEGLEKPKQFAKRAIPSGLKERAEREKREEEADEHENEEIREERAGRGKEGRGEGADR